MQWATNHSLKCVSKPTKWASPGLLQLVGRSPLSYPLVDLIKIQKVNMHGTVRLSVGSVTDTVNIRCIEPYKEVPDSIHGGECNM
jgi:hypothetical protein